mgnify:CR=1 FL=1
MKKGILLVVVVLFGFSMAFALAWDEIVEKANNGDAESMRELGAQYYHGKNVTQDMNEAFKWFLKSAENGSAGGQAATSYLYEEGIGVAQDSSKAFYWLKKSAENGMAESFTDLAYKYYSGYGCEVDFEQAAYWYKMGAANGETAAEHSLAYLYMEGKGVEKNADQAIYWFKKSAAKGRRGSYLHLAKLIYEGRKVTDYWLAHKYLKILAEEDNSDEAQYYLGLMYVDGLGVSADAYEGFKWIQKSANQENIDAIRLAICIKTGSESKKIQQEPMNGMTKLRNSSGAG